MWLKHHLELNLIAKPIILPTWSSFCRPISPFRLQVNCAVFCLGPSFTLLRIPGSNPACGGIFSGVESYQMSYLQNGTPVGTLPGAWRYRISAGTGRLGVSMLWLGEMESLNCNFYLSVAARKIVRADPSLRYIQHVAGTFSNQQTKPSDYKSATPYFLLARLSLF